MPIQSWTIHHTQSIHQTRVFTLIEQSSSSVLNPEKKGTFSVLMAPDWVNVIALTPDNEVVMIRQYRQGTRDITLEIPGGMVDPGEEFISAGLRELKEETGGVGSYAEQIGVVAPNPAIQQNYCGTILVRDVVLGEQSLEGNEEIEVVLYPLSDVPSLIQTGQITHSLVIAAFHFYHLYTLA